VRIIVAAPKECSIVNLSISLLLTFGFNRQDLVAGENVAASGYTIPLIKNQSNLHYKQKYPLTKNMRSDRKEININYN